jgi:hypothetical protein
LVKEITLGSGGEEITYEDITEMIKKSLTAWYLWITIMDIR